MIKFKPFWAGNRARAADRQGRRSMKTVYRIIGAQIVVTLAAAALALLLGDTVHAAYSALIGGGIGFFTAWIYARKAFGTRSAEPEELVKAQYRAEVLKLAFTVVLFAAAVVLYEEVSTLPLLLTYIATLAVYWVALLFA
jgi:ATP synthase protein I